MIFDLSKAEQKKYKAIGDGYAIFAYSPTCKGAKQYQALVEEIIRMNPQKER